MPPPPPQFIAGATPATVTQCKTCPWRTSCIPDTDIPNAYSRELHRVLESTIADGTASLRAGTPWMACHYSKVGAEHACAGWLHNQLGVCNNIAARLAVITGGLPAPVVDGEQHERFEDTIPRGPLPRRRTRNRG